MKNVFLSAIRTGDAFVFRHGGAVYVRCRGGFRPGCGGELVPVTGLLRTRVFRFE